MSLQGKGQLDAVRAQRWLLPLPLMTLALALCNITAVSNRISSHDPGRLSFLQLTVENITITWHKKARSHGLRRSIPAELCVVSNRHILQLLLTSADYSVE